MMKMFKSVMMLLTFDCRNDDCGSCDVKHNWLVF